MACNSSGGKGGSANKTKGNGKLLDEINSGKPFTEGEFVDTDNPLVGDMLDENGDPAGKFNEDTWEWEDVKQVTHYTKYSIDGDVLHYQVGFDKNGKALPVATEPKGIELKINPNSYLRDSIKDIDPVAAFSDNYVRSKLSLRNNPEPRRITEFFNEEQTSILKRLNRQDVIKDHQKAWDKRYEVELENHNYAKKFREKVDSLTADKLGLKPGDKVSYPVVGMVSGFESVTGTITKAGKISIDTAFTNKANQKTTTREFTPFAPPSDPKVRSAWEKRIKEIFK